MFDGMEHSLGYLPALHLRVLEDDLVLRKEASKVLLIELVVHVLHERVVYGRHEITPSGKPWPGFEPNWELARYVESMWIWNMAFPHGHD
jgi:hypothetical protein